MCNNALKMPAKKKTIDEVLPKLYMLGFKNARPEYATSSILCDPIPADVPEDAVPYSLSLLAKDLKNVFFTVCKSQANIAINHIRIYVDELYDGQQALPFIEK